MVDWGLSVVFPDVTTELPECSDQRDNDGDGLADFPADPDCSAVDDDDEGETAYQFQMAILDYDLGN